MSKRSGRDAWPFFCAPEYNLYAYHYNMILVFSCFAVLIYKQLIDVNHFLYTQVLIDEEPVSTGFNCYVCSGKY